MLESEARRVPKSLLWQCQGVERRCLLFELKGGTVLASVGAGNVHQCDWRSVAGYIQYLLLLPSPQMDPRLTCTHNLWSQNENKEYRAI